MGCCTIDGISIQFWNILRCSIKGYRTANIGDRMLDTPCIARMQDGYRSGSLWYRFDIIQHQNIASHQLVSHSDQDILLIRITSVRCLNNWKTNLWGISTVIEICICCLGVPTHRNGVQPTLDSAATARCLTSASPPSRGGATGGEDAASRLNALRTRRSDFGWFRKGHIKRSVETLQTNRHHLVCHCRQSTSKHLNRFEWADNLIARLWSSLPSLLPPPLSISPSPLNFPLPSRRRGSVASAKWHALKFHRKSRYALRCVSNRLFTDKRA